MVAITEELSRREADLFSNEIGSQYSVQEQIEIDSDALSMGRKVLKALSKGQKIYSVDELLAIDEGLDGKYLRGRVSLDGDVHRDEYKKPEVVVHEYMHDVLSQYDREERIHPEDYAQRLTGFVLEHLLDDPDPGVRNQARKGYASLQERMGDVSEYHISPVMLEALERHQESQGSGDRLGNILLDIGADILSPVADGIKAYLGYDPVRSAFRHAGRLHNYAAKKWEAADKSRQKGQQQTT